MSMGKRERIKIRFIVSAVCFGLTSLSTVLLPFIGEEQKIFAYIAGVLFWIGIVSGFINYLLLYRHEKKMLDMKKSKGKLPAGCAFFRNRFAGIADSIFIISLGGTIFFAVRSGKYGIWEWIMLFFCISSLYYHFLLNGKVFQYLSESKKRSK